MKLLFWNLNRNENSRYIAKLLMENKIDIAAFAEHKRIDRDYIKERCADYRIEEGMGGCDKVVFFRRAEVKMKVRREQSRYAMYTFKAEGREGIFVGLHLPANPHANSDARKSVIFDLVSQLKELEDKVKSTKTIVMGDFNASPFDSELTQTNMFNAVLFKELLRKKETVVYGGREYRRFYNPMLDYIMEKKQQYGSYYYESGISTLYWFCYDQVLFRKEVMDCLKDITFCKSIGGESILGKSGYPNKRVSDHLPLIVEVEWNEP